MEAGGQELPMHDGRNDPGFALRYVADPAPGRHTIGSGANRNGEIDIETLRKEYWRAFGWDPETGVPKRDPGETISP